MLLAKTKLKFIWLRQIDKLQRAERTPGRRWCFYQNDYSKINTDKWKLKTKITIKGLTENYLW